MRFQASQCGDLPATVSASCFRGESGVEEYHLMVRPTEYGSVTSQLGWVGESYRNALASLGLPAGTGVWRRFFCSDLPNQAEALAAQPFANPQDSEDPCAVSWVRQPPAQPAKVGLWAYHVKTPGGALEKHRERDTLFVNRGDLVHLWTTGLIDPAKESSYEQTGSLFAGYEGLLQSQGLSLNDHVIRTWLFVQNVDANYQGVVQARRECFTARGLTPETHYIASTGIEGTAADVKAKVLMDAYAIAGVRPEQIQFLAAPEYLCPTHHYGVTFERGVAVAYRDRKHVLLSGTASIDRTGSIVHPGNVEQQLQRTLENVEALLKQAGASFANMTTLIVYLRDISDMGFIQRLIGERFADLPTQVVLAPVCRPGWLIELECQAIVPASNPDLPAF